tara:strand:+ start:1800 stop:2423 length:624 start_codon:yes stop_codon:yes gene_type:complete
MAEKRITYYNVVQEILKRVNDADGDIYLDRAKELVYEGISSLAVSEGTSRDDIRGILKSETVDVSTLNPSWKIQIKSPNAPSGIEPPDDRVLGYNPAKIITIVNDLTDSETEYRYIEISLSELNRLNDEDYSPFDDEIFYYQRGEFIYFYPQERMITQKLVITYVAEPEYYTYDQYMSFLDGLYSSNFIYKVIDYGVGRIREQQSGE